MPGKGRGVVATKNLDQGEQIIFVPSDLLVAVDSDSEFLLQHYQQIEKCSIHGQIAAKYMLAFVEPDHRLQAWSDICPRFDEVRSCMPVFWPPDFQACLPGSSKALLRHQHDKMSKDLAILVASGYLETVRSKTRTSVADLKLIYKYVWMMANSRCFYWDYEYPGFPAAYGKDSVRASKSKQRRLVHGRDRDDCMALCPVIDCFNHSDSESCNVNFTVRGYSVTCTRDCEAGEELFVTYGQHSNDYLLVEYGFVLDENKADHVSLDSIILPTLSKQQEASLKNENLLRNYVLASNGVCHRTQCVLRLGILSEEMWLEFVNGSNDGEKEQQQVNKKLRSVLEDFIVEAKTKINQVEELAKSSDATEQWTAADSKAAKDAVVQRWEQIVSMAGACLETL